MSFCVGKAMVLNVCTAGACMIRTFGSDEMIQLAMFPDYDQCLLAEERDVFAARSIITHYSFRLEWTTSLFRVGKNTHCSATKKVRALCLMI